MKNYVLVFILNDDPHAYHFDFMNMRMIEQIKLYDPQAVPHKYFLANVKLMKSRSAFLFML